MWLHLATSWAQVAQAGPNLDQLGPAWPSLAPTQTDPNLVPTWPQLGPNFVPNWSQPGPNLVPTCPNLGSNIVAMRATGSGELLTRVLNDFGERSNMLAQSCSPQPDSAIFGNLRQHYCKILCSGLYRRKGALQRRRGDADDPPRGRLRQNYMCIWWRSVVYVRWRTVSHPSFNEYLL